ncbi:RCC1 domain-containing protein [Haliangium ochraceum]|uniref:RCC1 domain-containing protein n=1 Tax=Haliangium ochraceum TaxID=80816 RepID=UPI001E54127B|nr:hypothetical protein [Haliangium ochraceum]
MLGSGRVRCWGEGNEGLLGRAGRDWQDVGDDETPAAAGDIALDAQAVAVSLEYGSSCARLASGHVRCWGPRWGQEATRDLPPRKLADVELGGRVSALVSGAEHSCALMAEGAGLRCWGRGAGGRLGYPGADFVFERGEDTPAKRGDIAVGGTVREVAAGGEHTCAVLADETVRCWGRNSFGQLGLGHIKDVGSHEPPAAAPLVDVGGAVATVAAGAFHTCAALKSGRVRCWGRGADGQLGHGRREDLSEPAANGDLPLH